MKQNNLETVGGRVRQARIEAAMNMKTLAESVGVTATYLGVVERGERNPSAVLLQKIAQATNTTLEWLQTGREDSAKTLAGTQGQSTGGPVPVDIDAPLFLALAIRSVPNMTKEKMAAMLDMSLEGLDDVLSGRGQEPAAHWAGYFPLWAGQMDLPAVCQKIRDIDLFLQHQGMEKKRKCLYDSLKRYAGPEYQYFIPPVVKNSGNGGSLSDGSLHYEHIVFQKGETPGFQDMHFVFCQFDGDADDFPVDDIVGSHPQNMEMEDIYGELVYVFTDEGIIDAIRKYHGKIEEYKDALLAKDEFPGRLLPISMLLADSETWEVSGEIEQLGDWEDDF